jgi:hypothetical protein
VLVLSIMNFLNEYLLRTLYVLRAMLSLGIPKNLGVDSVAVLGGRS